MPKGLRHWRRKIGLVLQSSPSAAVITGSEPAVPQGAEWRDFQRSPHATAPAAIAPYEMAGRSIQWLVGMVLFTAAHLDGETATAAARADDAGAGRIYMG